MEKQKKSSKKLENKEIDPTTEGALSQIEIFESIGKKLEHIRDKNEFEAYQLYRNILLDIIFSKERDQVFVFNDKALYDLKYFEILTRPKKMYNPWL